MPQNNHGTGSLPGRLCIRPRPPRDRASGTAGRVGAVGVRGGGAGGEAGGRGGGGGGRGAEWRHKKTAPSPSATPPTRPSAALLFRGCVMDGLFSHVHEATIRTLTVNGYDVSEVPGQGCCGALHAHAGLHAAAQ